MANELAGRPLVSAAWSLLKRDPSMVVLLVVGGIASSVAFALVALPLYLVVGLPAERGSDPWSTVVYALALFASTFVSTFFLGAVVAAAMQRADGGDPTFRSAMAAAWERRGPLVAWAAMSTAVGIALRFLERFGVAGTIVRLLGGLAWAVATVFAIPVIMAEGTMPIETVKRSASVLTSRFGSNARAGLRFGVVVILLWIGLFAVFMLGIYGVYDGSTHRNGVSTALGFTMILAAIVGYFVASAVVQALGAYLRTVLYRYATGRPTPGIDPTYLPALLPLPGSPVPGAALAGIPAPPSAASFAWMDAPPPAAAPVLDAPPPADAAPMPAPSSVATEAPEPAVQAAAAPAPRSSFAMDVLPAPEPGRRRR
ncbi:MAG: DUF6159 family protein [Candidatus Nanopelagicales bacterium]|jgi:hypothetical protein